jgi:hypothetical protein
VGNRVDWGWHHDFQGFRERRGDSGIFKGARVIRFRLKGCKKCGGDLALDDGDWICLQCGTYYYVHLYDKSGRPGQGDAQEGPRIDKSALVASMTLGSQNTMLTATLAAVFLPVGAVNK